MHRARQAPYLLAASDSSSLVVTVDGNQPPFFQDKEDWAALEEPVLAEVEAALVFPLAL